jgi:hypothetical protein
MSDLVQDARYALNNCASRRDRCDCAVILGLSIGANTAVFGALNALLPRTLQGK